MSVGLEEIDLYDVGDNAIDGNDDVDEPLPGQTSIDQDIELIQAVELGRRSWAKDRRHRHAVDRDLHGAAISDAG